MPAAPAVDARRCRVCGRLRPASRFRRRHRGGSARLGDCNDCHAATERARRAAARSQADRRTIARAAAKLKRAASFEQVAHVVASMLHHFGDVARFVAVWRAQIDAALHRRPGSKTALDSCLAILSMLHFCESQRAKETLPSSRQSCRPG